MFGDDSKNKFKTPQRRAQQFEKMQIEYKKNNLDMQIYGFNPRDKSHSYLLEITALEGVRMPKTIQKHNDMKICAEFHVSFFYRNMDKDKQFFFGRTCKSDCYELNADAGGQLGFRRDIPMFFHSTLGAKNTATHVLAVIECVIVTQEAQAKTVKKEHYSGGYSTIKMFEVEK